MTRKHKTSNARLRFATLLLALALGYRGTQGFLDSLGAGWLGTAADAATGFAALIVAPELIRRAQKLTLAGGLVVVFIGICTVYALLMSLNSPLAALFGLRAMVLQLLTAFAVLAVIPETANTRTLRRLLLWVVILNSVVALRQAAFGLTPQELQQLAESGASYVVGSQTRLLGLQPTGQDLSLVLGAGTVWGSVQILRSGVRSAGLLTTCATLLGGVALLLVLQRSVLVGAAIALGAVVVALAAAMLRRRRGSRLVGRLALMIGACIVGFAMISIWAPAQFDEGVQRLLSLSDLTGDTSWRTRLATTVPVALGLIGEAPFGHGIGTSGPVGATFQEGNPLARYPLGGLAADNGYLFVALQLGLPATALFFAMLTSWAIRGSLYSDGPASRATTFAVIIFLMGTMLSGSFWGLASTMSIVLTFAAIPSMTGTDPALSAKITIDGTADGPQSSGSTRSSALPRTRARGSSR